MRALLWAVACALSCSSEQLSLPTRGTGSTSGAGAASGETGGAWGSSGVADGAGATAIAGAGLGGSSGAGTSGAGTMASGAGGSVAGSGSAVGGAGGSAPQPACPEFPPCATELTCDYLLSAPCGSCSLGTFACGEKQGFYSSRGNYFTCDPHDCTAATEASGAECSECLADGGTGASGGAAGGSGTSGSGGSSGLGGAAPFDAERCTETTGQLLWAERATGIFGADERQSLDRNTHNLVARVPSAPDGYCSLLGGSRPNDSTGANFFPNPYLCLDRADRIQFIPSNQPGYPVPSEAAAWNVTGVCLRIARNHWYMEGGFLLGDVDEAWEFWGTAE